MAKNSNLSSITSPEPPKKFLSKHVKTNCAKNLHRILEAYKKAQGFNESIYNELSENVEDVIDSMGKHFIYTSDEYYETDKRFVYAMIVSKEAQPSKPVSYKLFQVVCDGENRLKLYESDDVVVYS